MALHVEDGNSVIVREVGLRDGLQLVKTILATEHKNEWYRASVAAGFKEIEVTSFVPAKVAPQFADAEQVASAAVAYSTDHAAALVPNLRGAQRALEIGMRNIHFVLSVSNSHNLANVRKTTDESIAEFGRIVEFIKLNNFENVVLTAGMATCFGCSIEGNVTEQQVLEVLAKLLHYSPQHLAIADTVGYGNPAQVRQVMHAVQREVSGSIPVTCHFHDTRGLGLANVVAALESDVRIFDASMAGLGGCPFAPTASGNINTEDCIFMLEAMGLKTGIDLDKVLQLRERVVTWLPGEPFTGAIARAGTPKGFAYAS